MPRAVTHPPPLLAETAHSQQIYVYVTHARESENNNVVAEARKRELEKATREESVCEAPTFAKLLPSQSESRLWTVEPVTIGCASFDATVCCRCNSSAQVLFSIVHCLSLFLSLSLKISSEDDSQFHQCRLWPCNLKEITSRSGLSS